MNENTVGQVFNLSMNENTVGQVFNLSMNESVWTGWKPVLRA